MDFSLTWERCTTTGSSKVKLMFRFIKDNKLPDVIKFYSCQLFYDEDGKPSNFTLTLVPEQHSYATRIASLQHLNPIIGCYFWNDIPISSRQKPTKQLLKQALFQYLILLSITLVRLKAKTETHKIHSSCCASYKGALVDKTL